MWFESAKGKKALFVGFVQIFDDNTALNLRSTAMVTYLAHEIFLNLLQIKKQWALDNEDTKVELLRVRCREDEVEDKESSESVDI